MRRRPSLARLEALNDEIRRAENEGDDLWTLYSEPRAPTVQFEHTVVATANGPLILTLPA